jgi:ubiquinone/menaquinone biosynthesis C-methylase UbiE
MIEIVRNKSSIEKITNIEFYYLDLLVDGSGLTSGSMEYVMLFNILHHNRPLELLSESFRVLKPGAKTGIIHWRSDIATPRGPDLSIRPTPEHCSDWAIESGFKIIKQAEIISPYHFGIVIQKP